MNRSEPRASFYHLNQQQKRHPSPFSSSSSPPPFLPTLPVPVSHGVPISKGKLILMGFPVGYTEVFLPKILLNGLSFLGFIRTLISSLFLSLGLSDFFLDPPDSHRFDPLLDIPRVPDSPPVSAVLIREFLPVLHYQGPSDPTESCAVCLYELEVGDEIRELRNCCHVFHRSCLDRWLDCDQKTCPLCRTQFVPDCMQDEFHQRLWAASGIVGADFYSEYASL